MKEVKVKKGTFEFLVRMSERTGLSVSEVTSHCLKYALAQTQFSSSGCSGASDAKASS